MAFDFQCPNCQCQFRPAPAQVGKLAACPQCGTQVRIPVGEVRIPTVEQCEDPRWKAPAIMWYVQAEDGKQFGPVTGEQLHIWYEEGRITADCQLLRKGAGQWQWATDLYPDLESASKPNPLGPKAVRTAQPRSTKRVAPAPTSIPLTPLDPNDFPTVGAGLKLLGAANRPLPPALEDPQLRSLEALENRRKYAPFMVAHLNRPPLHKMLLAVAIGNFVMGTLRGGLYSVLFLRFVLAAGTLEEDADQQVVVRGAFGLIIALVMIVLNVAMIGGGIGLLQQKEWGRTATLFGAFVGMIIQLTGVCVTMLLGADGSGLARVVWVLVLVALGPGILYDAFAAGALILRSVVADLEE